MIKAMILSAGYGKRLNPLTLEHPKPLLTIGKETLLSNTIKFLQEYGIKEIVINVHYLAEQIIDYINEKKFNLSINIIKEEDKILDTGGGVLNAIKYFSDEPFLIINPDTLWNKNYNNELKLMEKRFTINKDCKCTMLLVNKDKSFDKSFTGDFNLINNLITREKKNNLKYIYTGMQVIDPSAFSELNVKAFSINQIWDKLISKKELFGEQSKNDFFHVSNLEIYNALKKNFKH